MSLFTLIERTNDKKNTRKIRQRRIFSMQKQWKHLCKYQSNEKRKTFPSQFWIVKQCKRKFALHAFYIIKTDTQCHVTRTANNTQFYYVSLFYTIESISPGQHYFTLNLSQALFTYEFYPKTLNTHTYTHRSQVAGILHTFCCHFSCLSA